MTRIGFTAGVIAQVMRRYDPEGANGRQRASLRPAQRVLPFPKIVHNLSLGSARQVQVLHKRIARITVTRVPIPFGLALVVAITRVGL